MASFEEILKFSSFFTRQFVLLFTSADRKQEPHSLSKRNA